MFKKQKNSSLEPQTYRLAAFIFLRALAVIYVAAFWSLWIQVDPLIGAEGISPASQLLDYARNNFGLGCFWGLPSLLWINQSELFVDILCGSGLLCSLLLAIGLAEKTFLIVNWVIYLSFVVVLQPFPSFQGDLLLLEAGFLAVFLLPPRKDREQSGNCPPRTVVFLLKWLLFRVLFSSGVYHLSGSFDDWWNSKTFDYYFLFQPLPNPLSYYAHFSPQWLKSCLTAGVVVIELFLPFLFFSIRPLRLAAGLAIIGFEACIFLTGNSAWLAPLTAAIAVILFDDRALRRFLPKSYLERKIARTESVSTTYSLKGRQTILLIVVLYVSGIQLCSLVFGNKYIPAPALTASKWVKPFFLVNSYDPFIVDTTKRFEIILEGSNDGEHWKPFEFEFKPGSPQSPPPSAVFGFPRLDYSMWFLALTPTQRNPWFFRLVKELLEGSPTANRLFDTNPFPDSPPHLIRALFYSYEFAPPFYKETLGAWWERELLGFYLPPASLKDFSRSLEHGTDGKESTTTDRTEIKP